eukprot:SAG11_NODE_630_length_8069_cov_2.158344_6_plen_154_part_00
MQEAIEHATRALAVAEASLAAPAIGSHSDLEAFGPAAMAARGALAEQSMTQAATHAEEQRALCTAHADERAQKELLQQQEVSRRFSHTRVSRARQKDAFFAMCLRLMAHGKGLQHSMKPYAALRFVLLWSSRARPHVAFCHSLRSPPRTQASS